MFKKFFKLKAKHQVLFSILIAFAVISFWRGIWGLMDVYLFPEDMALSLVASVVIGLVILIGTHYATEELI